MKRALFLILFLALPAFAKKKPKAVKLEKVRFEYVGNRIVAAGACAKGGKPCAIISDLNGMTPKQADKRLREALRKK